MKSLQYLQFQAMRDAFGHRWRIASALEFCGYGGLVEDVKPVELEVDEYADRQLKVLAEGKVHGLPLLAWGLRADESNAILAASKAAEVPYRAGVKGLLEEIYEEAYPEEKRILCDATKEAAERY